jgi:hypothetical protein
MTVEPLLYMIASQVVWVATILFAPIGDSGRRGTAALVLLALFLAMDIGVGQFLIMQWLTAK